MRLWILLICSLSCFTAAHGSTQELSDMEFPPTQGPPDPSQGQLVQWEGWSFRWQFRDIEGLMLTDVFFQGKKVLKAINLAEICVPYATGWPRPEDFSLGGFRANPMPLQLGKDCAANGTQCRAFNRDGSQAKGGTADVMIHEESIGFLYAGKQGRAPGKMLVLWAMVHFPGPNDGYTYVIRWKLRILHAVKSRHAIKPKMSKFLFGFLQPETIHKDHGKNFPSQKRLLAGTPPAVSCS